MMNLINHFHSIHYPSFQTQTMDFYCNDFSSYVNLNNENILDDIASNNDQNMDSRDIFWIRQEKNHLINKESSDEIEKDTNMIDKSTKQLIQQKIKENIHSKKPFKEKKKLGRKIKSNECLGEHNKFSDDNIHRKLRNAVLKSVLRFINQKIKIIYSIDPKIEIKDMRLLKLKQNSLEKGRVDYNKKLLNLSLKSIFSEEVSSKYSRYLPHHNKDLIEKLLNETDEKKYNVFNKIFNLTFSDCLNHFRGSSFVEELSGLKNFEEYFRELKSVKNKDVYKKVLKYSLDNYEKEIMEKRERKRFKKFKIINK